MTARIVDYDRIADRYDRRYGLYQYDGVRETLLAFLGEGTPAALEVGCGTGHWLGVAGARTRLLAGLEPSALMLRRAQAAATGAHLVRARAEALPWRDATFDRIFCINALHHFSDRARFFAEARRVLRPGGGVLTIAKDPHAGRDEWWVYDYFAETRDIDLARYAAVRTLRGELALAGFAWAESSEADRIEATHSARDAFASGVVARGFTSQLDVLSDEEFDRGVQRIRDADEARRADGAELQLVSDFRLYATVGWLA